jgi:hypothetical protein
MKVTSREVARSRISTAGRALDAGVTVVDVEDDNRDQMTVAGEICMTDDKS